MGEKKDVGEIGRQQTTTQDYQSTRRWTIGDGRNRVTVNAKVWFLRGWTSAVNVEHTNGYVVRDGGAALFAAVLDAFTWTESEMARCRADATLPNDPEEDSE